MAEKVLHERIEPTVRSLDERVTMLEQRVKLGKETVETFTRENPMMTLGITLLVGAGFGFLLGLASSKSKD